MLPVKTQNVHSKSLQLSQLPLVNAWPVASQWFVIPCLLNANALERRKKLHVNVCHAVQGWHLGPACLLNSTARLLKWPSSTPRSAHCCLQPCQYSQEQAPTRTLHNHQQQQEALQIPSSSLLKALLSKADLHVTNAMLMRLARNIIFCLIALHIAPIRASHANLFQCACSVSDFFDS